MVKGGGGVLSRSRFTENKTVLSQFTKNKIGISRFTEEKKKVFLLTKVTYRYLGHFRHRVDALPPFLVEIDETEDETDGWPKVTENQTNHVVVRGINRPVPSIALRIRCAHNAGQLATFPNGNHS